MNKKNFINKKIYVKVVQVVGFKYMNHRAKYWPEGVFVQRGGGGRGLYGILYEISFYFFVLQHVQAAGAIQKYIFCDFSVSNDRHTCILEYQLYMYTCIYQLISLLFVKI